MQREACCWSPTATKLCNVYTTEIIPRRGKKWRESLYLSNSVPSRPVDGHVLLVVGWWVRGGFEGVVGDTRPIKDEWYPANVCEYVRGEVGPDRSPHTVFGHTLYLELLFGSR